MKTIFLKDDRRNQDHTSSNPRIIKHFQNMQRVSQR